MSVYMTEEEQIQAIKKWWQANSNLVTIIFSILLLSFMVFKYWNLHQEKVLQQASDSYEHLMLAVAHQDNKAVKAYANQLINEYNQTIYAKVARLTLTKLYASRGDYAKAREVLLPVTTKSKNNVFQPIAVIRMSRLLSVEKSYDLALDELNKVQDKTYDMLTFELKGDILSAQGNYAGAIAAYQQSSKVAQKHNVSSAFLDMKKNALLELKRG